MNKPKPKSKSILVRITEQEYEVLKNIRAKHNVSISHLVRQSILFYAMEYR